VAVLLTIIVWVVLTFILAKLAENKRRSYKLFFIIGLFLSPIIGYVILHAIGDKSKALQRKQIKKGIVKICPFCAGANILKGEPIIVCQHCKREIRTEYYKGNYEEDIDKGENYEENDDDENDEEIKKVFDEIFEKKKLYENAYEEDNYDNKEKDDERYSRHDKNHGIENIKKKDIEQEERNISNNNKRTISTAENYYCKWCGVLAHEVYRLTSDNCSRNPQGKKHELYEGGEKSQYTCKYCGVKFPSIEGLTARPCSKSPHKKHHPAL
jgi:hypothetical protein